MNVLEHTQYNITVMCITTNAIHFNTRLIGVSMFPPENYNNSRMPQDSNNDDHFAIQNIKY